MKEGNILKIWMIIILSLSLLISFAYSIEDSNQFQDLPKDNFCNNQELKELHFEIIPWTKNVYIITNNASAIKELNDFKNSNKINVYDCKKQIYLPIIYIGSIPTASCDNVVEKKISDLFINGEINNIPKVRIYFNKPGNKNQFTQYISSSDYTKGTVSEIIKELSSKNDIYEEITKIRYISFGSVNECILENIQKKDCSFRISEWNSYLSNSLKNKGSISEVLELMPITYRLFVLTGIQRKINGKTENYDLIPEEIKVLGFNELIELRDSITDSLKKELGINLKYKIELVKYINSKCSQQANTQQAFDNLYYTLYSCFCEEEIQKYLQAELSEILRETSPINNIPKRLLSESPDLFNKTEFGKVYLDDKLEKTSLYELTKKLNDNLYYVNFSSLKSFVSTIETRSKDYLIDRIRTTIGNLIQLEKTLSKKQDFKIDVKINGEEKQYSKKEVCDFLMELPFKKEYTNQYQKLNRQIVRTYFNGNYTEFYKFVCDESDIFKIIYWSAKKQGFDPLLILALVSVESNGNYKAESSSSSGLMQLSRYSFEYGIGDSTLSDLRMYPTLNLLTGILMLNKNYKTDISLYQYNYGSLARSCSKYTTFFERLTCIMKTSYYNTARESSVYDDFLRKDSSCILYSRPKIYDPSNHIFSNSFYKEKQFETKITYKEKCESVETKTKEIKVNNELDRIISKFFNGQSTVYETGRYASKILSTYILLKLSGIRTDTLENFEYGLKQLYLNPQTLDNAIELLDKLR
ncbi:MAG: Transglycosylase domain [Candidatus Woesearchaeota archaeon]|nr:Transglycosylase domain [Candidatus Woesearchaeota archaeon]